MSRTPVIVGINGRLENWKTHVLIGNFDASFKESNAT